MSELGKITSSHLKRRAFVYVRQSTGAQVIQHRESVDRQYALVERARSPGWSDDRVSVIDEDLGVSGSGTVERSGFAQMAAEVALGHVGVVLGLEVSRLARNNADWYRLLDLCGVTDTLIGDADGIYHPGQFNDRMILGLKGTMSEAELHSMRLRLDGGRRNKAKRGELRSNLPVGLVWGEGDGEIQLDPDEAVRGAISTVFERFAEKGSARQVWLWLRAEGLQLPRYFHSTKAIVWVVPTYTMVRELLINPAYAGAYVFGKTHTERHIDDTGRVRIRRRKLPRSEWAVMLPEHHEGYIDWETYEANQCRLAENMRPLRGRAGGAVREGAALLQGLARCGHCGRGLRVTYGGRHHTPYYFCANDQIIKDRGIRCLWVSGRLIHEATINAFLDALAPAGVRAAVRARQLLESNHDVALFQWERQVEKARYEAQLAERRYRAVDPDNRLVARGLETEWEHRLRELQQAEGELRQRSNRRPRELTERERASLDSLGTDLRKVWTADTTQDRDRKELLRALLEEVTIAIEKPARHASLKLRWHGGHQTDLDVHLPRRPANNRTEEKTVDLIRRLTDYYSDREIAGILNRQGRTTSRGLAFTAPRIKALRHTRDIPCGPTKAADGDVVSLQEAARRLDVDASTVHRWLHEGIIPGEQLTTGAPWRIRLTEELVARFVEAPPDGYVRMKEAMSMLGVSRQTVLQRVKRGELESVHVRRGRRIGLLIKVEKPDRGLFDVRGKTKE